MSLWMGVGSQDLDSVSPGSNYSDTSYPSILLCSQIFLTSWLGAGSLSYRLTDQNAASREGRFGIEHRSGTPKSQSHRRTFPVPGGVRVRSKLGEALPRLLERNTLATSDH